MTGVSGKSDTEARSPAVSMISATLARSGPGESLGGAGHSRTTPRKGRVVPDKRLTQLYRPEKRAFRIRPAGRQFVRPAPETLALGKTTCADVTKQAGATSPPAGRCTVEWTMRVSCTQPQIPTSVSLKRHV